MKLHHALAVLSLVTITAAVHAQVPEPSPTYFGDPPTLETLRDLRSSGQWNLQAKTVLAQALWGEAGIIGHYTRTPLHRRVVTCGHDDAGGNCHVNEDWRLIPWVLLSRWQARRARGSRISFANMVRAYSSPVRPRLASDSRLRRAHATGDHAEVSQIMRRRFLQALRFDGSNLLRARSRFRRRASPDVYTQGWREITDVVDEWGRGEIPNPCEDARHWDSRSARPRNMVRVCPDLETLNLFFAVPRRRPGSA